MKLVRLGKDGLILYQYKVKQALESRLCVNFCWKRKMVLYTRAEKIAEVSSLEDIWGLDIGKTIEYLKKKKLYIYIDALEFIVDCSKTKMDLLQQIYEIVKGHNNIFIIG